MLLGAQAAAQALQRAVARRCSALVPGRPFRDGRHAHGGYRAVQAVHHHRSVTRCFAFGSSLGRLGKRRKHTRRTLGFGGRSARIARPLAFQRGRPRVSVRHRREVRRAAGRHRAVRRGRPRAASRGARPLALERLARERAPARRGRSRGVVAHDATVVRRDRPLGGGQRLFSRAGGGADRFDGRRVHGRGAAGALLRHGPHLARLGRAAAHHASGQNRAATSKAIRLRDVRRPGGNEGLNAARREGSRARGGGARSWPHEASAAVASRTRRLCSSARAYAWCAQLLNGKKASRVSATM